jgi:hypothetical protein
VNPFTERHQLRLLTLPPDAEDLLRRYHAPPRLIAHLLLVHDVAGQLLDALQAHDLAHAINVSAVLFGAATHDIGKVVHPDELTEPGQQHEMAGEMLLLQAGIPAALARFAATHGQAATGPSSDIDELLVALADTCWKGTRDRVLEQRIITERTAQSGRDPWDCLLVIDAIIEDIAAAADQRLRWHANFPVKA